MTLVYWITLFLVLLYLLYPVWLLMIQPKHLHKGQKSGDTNSISLILLTYNGKYFSEKKITFLLKELSDFKNRELIIIDDCSTDGTDRILENFRDMQNIRIIQKTHHKGIPHSMNLGAEMAMYENIVFCDQRQKLSDNALMQIVEPLAYENVGAVSGCISPAGSGESESPVRKHENFLKTIESNSGNMIGVYGPFYAIKKECYSHIPENIILDDLYLSLRILSEKQIIMNKQCRITDDSFSHLYDYKRIKRYLAGFSQILKDKELIANLSRKQRIMLFWHKYIRLLIPVFLFLSYVSVGFMMDRGIEYLILFIVLTITGLLSFFPGIIKLNFHTKSVVRINILYLIAFFDILKNNLLVKDEKT